MRMIARHKGSAYSMISLNVVGYRVPKPPPEGRRRGVKKWMLISVTVKIEPNSDGFDTPTFLRAN